MATKTKLITILCLLLVSVFSALMVSDLVFRWYESRYLLEKASVGEEEVDLAGLKFNDSTVRRKKSGDEFRILSFGDSFAWGPVKYPHTYHAYAARHLEDILPGKRVRIVNLGEPSTSLYQYMRGYEFWGEVIEHDGAVFTVFLGNDLLEISFGHVPDEQGPTESLNGLGDEVQIRSRVPTLYPLRMLDYLYAYYLSSRESGAGLRAEESDPYHDFVSQLSEEKYYENSYNQLINFDPDQVRTLERGYRAVASLAYLASEIRESGRQVAIMLAPNENQVDAGVLEETVRRYHADPNRYDLSLSAFLVAEIVRGVDPAIPVLDLSVPFEAGIRRGRDLYYGTNTHWSAEGNALAGSCLARFLAEHWFESTLERSGELGEFIAAEHRPMADDRRGSVRLELVKTFVRPLLADQLQSSTLVSHEALGKLELRPHFFRQSIDTVNGVRFAGSTNRKVAQAIPGNGNGFSLSGWAVDVMAGEPAAEVFVEINGQLYRADYGIPRVDVAQTLGDSRFNLSGYSLRLPEDSVGSGVMALRIIVLSSDLLAYNATELRYVQLR